MVSHITSCTTQFIGKLILLISSNVSDLNGWINESIDKGMDEKLAEIIGKERIKKSTICFMISFTTIPKKEIRSYHFAVPLEYENNIIVNYV